MDFTKDDDHHWDFLDEIEAPMWVDLTVEAKSIHHNIDENWFIISHPIHQSSASQIKAAYKQTKKGHGKLQLELQGPPSPKLPSSVSRSRGKDYRSKNWGMGSKSFLSNNQHPIKRLGGKTINEGLGSSQKAESNTNGRNLKLSKDCESNSARSTVTNNSKTIPCTGGSRRSLQHVTSKVGERNSRSTVTMMSGQQQQKSSARSSQTVSGTTEIFLATRMTLKKGCVTRQASRVDFNDGRHAIGRQSCSGGKSSVGSSSSLSYNVSIKQYTKKEVSHRTPDSGSVVDDSRPANTKVKLDVSRASTSHPASRSSYCTNPKGGNTVLTECAQQGAAKSKLICQPTKRKALLPRRINEQGQVTASVKAGDKFQVSKINKCVASEKENALARGLGAEEKVTAFRVKQTEPKKVVKKGLVGSKVKASDFEGKSSRKVIHDVHFR